VRLEQIWVDKAIRESFHDKFMTTAEFTVRIMTAKAASIWGPYEFKEVLGKLWRFASIWNRIGFEIESVFITI
jgi:hypothetical protein